MDYLVFNVFLPDSAQAGAPALVYLKPCSMPRLPGSTPGVSGGFVLITVSLPTCVEIEF